MLDFGHNRWSAPDYLGRSQQQRLLLATMAAGLVVAMIVCLADPASWQWLAQIGRSSPGGQHAAIDTRLPSHDSQEPLRVAQNQKPSAATPQPGKIPSGVDAARLADIHDDTPLEPGELPALFELLKLVRDPQTLAGASPEAPAFIQLLEQPKVFRGQLVRVRGRVHRAMPVTVSDKGHPSTELVQLWLEPRNDQPNPVVIDCIEVPKGFPHGLSIDEQAEVTGLYFKRLAYTDQEHNTRLAPMIVAQGVEWFPHRPVIRKRMDRKQLAAGVTVALVAAVVLLALVLPRRRGSILLSEQPSGSRTSAEFGRLDALRNLQVSAESREALERIEKTESGEQKGQP